MIVKETIITLQFQNFRYKKLVIMKFQTMEILVKLLFLIQLSQSGKKVKFVKSDKG